MASACPAGGSATIPPEANPSLPGRPRQLGAAHGITGPLLLLAQALRRGITVNGHHEAMWTICEHLDVWCQLSPSGPWWPEHISRRDFGRGRPTTTPHAAELVLRNHGHRTGRATRRARPARPDLQAFYEDALYRALTDSEQLAHVTDSGLCHGWAGIYQTATRAAADALDHRLQTLPRRLGDTLAAHAQPCGLPRPG
ncbi:hypothetical protein NKH18_07420 [Streptomyces sp. M10(2022)]